jgi:hypothetical protein
LKGRFYQNVTDVTDKKTPISLKENKDGVSFGLKSVTTVTSVTSAEGARPQLCRSAGVIIEFWIAKGRPVVFLGPGDLEQDLELLLSHDTIMPSQIEAINKWYVDNGGK